jgi:hypothetical protein
MKNTVHPVKNNIYGRNNFKIFYPGNFFFHVYIVSLIFNVKLSIILVSPSDKSKKLLFKLFLYYFCVFLLLSNLKNWRFFSNFILLNDSGGNAIKKWCTFLCLFIFLLKRRTQRTKTPNFLVTVAIWTG